mgnify:CR=1 FL=1
MTMTMEYLISDLSSSIPILQKISDGQKLSFDEAWSLVTLYKKYKDTDSIVDYVEGTPKSGYTQLRVDVEDLVKETTAILNIYYSAKKQFKDFDAKALYKKYLEPLKSTYEQAQEVSAKAYKDYKEVDNSLDMPEARYSKEELPRIWGLHAQKKEYADKCSKRTKELFMVYDRERRRTARLFNFKLSAFVMLVYSLNEMSKALLADLNDIEGKEGHR